MGTLRFFEEVVSFKIRRTFGFADYRWPVKATERFFSASTPKSNQSAVIFQPNGQQ